MLTVMAKTVIPSGSPKFRLEEWLPVKGFDMQSLADAMDTSHTNVWRWCRGKRTPDETTQARIAQVMGIPDWRDLWKTPAEAGAGALLGGLPEPAKRDALDYIEALRKRHS
jgi:transcriptional regulator with XRE-family HTH domain